MATECRRCLLNDEVPGVKLAADGECSVCKTYDAEWGNWPAMLEQRGQELARILAAARNPRRAYDALVPLSGGKDSTYVLYLARRRFGLRCLAVTFDNGFLADHARGNIQRAVDALGADHVIVRLNWPLQQKIYRTFFLKTGFFCPACMSGIEWAIESSAAAHRIPLVLKGTSVRTEEHVAPEFFLPASPDFFRAVLEGEPVALESPIQTLPPLPKRLLQRYAGIEAVEKHSYGAAINLPDYIEWDYDEIYRTIVEEVGWTAHKERAEHTDCVVDPAVDYIRQRKCPAVVPELTRYAKLVTIGKMTKDAAREKVGESRPGGDLPEPPSLTVLLERLGITREQFEETLSDSRRHLPYLQKHYGIRARTRQVLGRVLGR